MKFSEIGGGNWKRRDTAKENGQICNCKLAENRYFQKQAYVLQIFRVDEKSKSITYIKKPQTNRKKHSFIINTSTKISKL